MFSKDPEILVSIICPDPYFTSVDPIVLTGQTAPNAAPVTTFEYNGSVEAGIHVKITQSLDPEPDQIGIQIGDPSISFFAVDAVVDINKYFEMSSVPRRKFVQNVNVNTGAITNLLSQVTAQNGAPWPVLQPGENEFSVYTNIGEHDWELTYYERFGGL